MSNRIRILFNCQGSIHMGRKALSVMEGLLKNPPQEPVQKWVSQQEWQKLGRPNFLERRLRFDSWTNKAVYDYYIRVFGPAKTSPTSKIELDPKAPVVHRAKWLWEHLPAEVRQASQLFVTRENRRNCWRKSWANPRLHGRPKSAKAPFTTTVPSLLDSDMESMAKVVFEASGDMPWKTPQKKQPPNFKASLERAKAKVYSKNIKYAPDSTASIPAPIEGQSAPPIASKPKKLGIGIWS